MPQALLIILPLVLLQQPEPASRGERFVSSWQRRAASHTVLKNYGAYEIHEGESPFVFFVHGGGFELQRGSERLGRDLERELQDVVKRFDEWIVTPLGLDREDAAGLHAVWVTADRELFAWSLPLLGIRDREAHAACFSRSERAVFALVGSSGQIHGEALREFRQACALALLDGLGSKGLSAARNLWLPEGLAWLIATGGAEARDEAWREECGLFLSAGEAELDETRALLADQGFGSGEIESGDERRASWSPAKYVAAHAIVEALFFGRDPSWRMKLLEWLRTELHGGPTEGLPARALGFHGPQALIDQARGYLRDALARQSEVRVTRMPEPAEIAARLEILVPLAALDLEGAERVARRVEAAPELSAVAILRAFLGRLGERLDHDAQTVLIEEGGRRQRREAVGMRNDRILIRDGSEGRIRKVAAGRIGAQVISLAHRSKLVDPEDHVALAILGALWGDSRLARHELRRSGAGEERAAELLARWEADLPELEAYRTVSSLLEDDSERVIEAARQARERHARTRTWQRARGAIRAHLREAIRTTLGRPEEVFEQRYPAGRWESGTRRVTVHYDFSKDGQLAAFEPGSYGVLKSVFGYLSRQKPEPVRVTAKTLEMSGSCFTRHRLWLSLPIEVRLTRAFHGRFQADTLGKGYLGPALVIGMLDDGEGSFLAVERSFQVVDVRHGRVEGLARCRPDHVEEVDHDRFHSMRARCEEGGVTVWLDGEIVLQLERGLPSGGRVFLQTAGIGSVRIEDLTITGQIDRRAEERLRQDVVEEQVDAVLGSDG